MEKPRTELESIPELRRLVQEPVEHRNDLTGKLYGSRVSIFITRFFLKRGWSANVASFLMLANGLAGSVLLVFPGWWQVLGFFLLETYYLFDCVDGELARYYRTSHLKAAYYDYLAHVLVKSAMFLGLGVGLARSAAVDHPWPIYVAIVPTLSILFTKIASDVHHVIFASKFILSRDDVAIAGFMRERAPVDESRDAIGEPSGETRRPTAGMIRELLLNFDLYLILFMGAAALDQLVALPAAWPAWLGFKMALFLAYSAALPLNFLDHALADLVTNRLMDRVDELRIQYERSTDEEGASHTDR